MAISVLSLVWQLPARAVSAPERLVLLCLADHAHADGRGAWPAVRTIAERTSLSRRAVQKILRRLESRQFTTAEGLMARGAVLYALDLEALDRERYSQSHEHRADIDVPLDDGRG